MGFNDKWCSWVKECIQKASFSVLVNGSPVGFFQSTNGIRQGDPLSPLLFSLCMEMFSISINEAITNSEVSTPFSQGEISISHLLFADDMLVFAEATPQSALGVKRCIQRFNHCSELEVNINKSEIFFTEKAKQVSTSISSILSIPEGQFPIKYLGLPLISTRLRISDCTMLISKIQKRIAGWANRCLSRAGRVELAKTVLNSFQLYWSASFNLPSTILDKIEQIIRNFIWAGHSQRKVIHANILDWFNPIRFWFNHKYLKRKNFWTMNMPSRPSWGARSIFKAREEANRLICYVIGDGKGIDFWKQPWHPDGLISHLYPEGRILNSLPQSTTVDNLLSNGEWIPTNQRTLPGLHLILNSALIIPGNHNQIKRNRRIFDKSNRHKQSILWDIIHIIRSKIIFLRLDGNLDPKDNFLAAKLKLPKFSKPELIKTCSWIPPDEGRFKLNSDASLCQTEAAIGGLIRDSNSNIITTFSINMPPKSIQELEMQAILVGTASARKLGLNHLWIESDSLFAVNAINGKIKCQWK
ncbi:uncharacterized protein LOC143859080 [Tasmannia lanceolata]|uniref:uncharacterized protein LOC143858468 n=1 Tax=Tasmannia lanceolata TaxID=3420 RepID=UPI004062A3A3